MVCCISHGMGRTMTTSTCDLPSLPPSLPPFLRLAPQRVQHRTGLDCTTTSSSSSSSSSTNSRPALLTTQASRAARKSRRRTCATKCRARAAGTPPLPGAGVTLMRYVWEGLSLRAKKEGSDGAVAPGGGFTRPLCQLFTRWGNGMKQWALCRRGHNQ